MLGGMGSFRLLRFGKHARIRLAYHLLTEVHADQVLLEDVVVEHVLSGFTQVNNPVTQWGWLYPIGHILSIDRAGRVVVAANTTNAARDEVGIAWVFALHEQTEA